MDCPFCDFEREIKFRLLAQTEHLYLIPALGAFIEGYLLIVSKDHLPNLGSIPIKWHKEIKELQKKARKFLEKNYKKDIIEFEHGECSADRRQAGGCIAHFHIALVATNAKLLKTIKKDLGAAKKISRLNNFSTSCYNSCSYILYSENPKTYYYWESPRVISQYIRRLLTSEQKIFDWRQFEFKDAMKRIIDLWKKS